MALDNTTLYKLLKYLNEMIASLEEKEITPDKFGCQ